ncbi:MAG: efflux transporter outer membrane subunit [Verrucomicrobiales bacterium]
MYDATAGTPVPPFPGSSRRLASGILLVILLSLALAAFFTGCALVGPDYERPEIELPASFKESQTWRRARPRDHETRGEWWRVFNDPTLNRLEARADAGNRGLRAAMLRVMQARELARGAGAGLLPDVDFNSSFDRRRTSGTLQQSSSDFFSEGGSFSGRTRNSYRLPIEASWEIDFWGKVRRSIEAVAAEADAAAALYENARLALHADLAQNYFALRSLEAELDLLRSSVALRGETLGLVRNRFQGGATNELDVVKAETELAATESEAVALEKLRSELINAIAVLVGQPASSFSLSVRPLREEPPAVPAGVPSDLLERRPDVAEAERRTAAANARIGVAKAAFFPSVRLTGRAGFESAEIADLLQSPSRAWSIGPSVNIPIFEQVVNKSVYDRRKLEYEETVENFRQRVLIAIQEVENALSGLHVLRRQAGVQERAVNAANKTSDLSNNRYKAGLVAYFEVVDAERTRLQALRLARQIQGQRFLITVQLIKALGGGWRVKP